MDQQLHMWRVHSTQKSIYCISVLAKSRTIVDHKVNKDSHIEVNVAVQGFVDFLKRECKSIMSLAFIYGRKFIFSRLSLQDTSPGFEYESEMSRTLSDSRVLSRTLNRFKDPCDTFFPLHDFLIRFYYSLKRKVITLWYMIKMFILPRLPHLLKYAPRRLFNFL